VTVHCKTHKCKKRTRHATEINLAGRFGGRGLGSGTHLTIFIVKPTWIGRAYTFITRAGTVPREKRQCLAPGATSKPGVGC
jgi:hypothetical protein